MGLNKEKGWTWKYGSGVIAQKYYAPGYGDMKKKEEKEWLGKRVFYTILDVVRFVLLTEENGGSQSSDSDSSSEDEESDKSESEENATPHPPVDDRQDKKKEESR